jgi:epoxyqueuosine reductase QueG
MSPAVAPYRGTENMIHKDEITNLLDISQGDFDLRYGNTPVSRAKKDGFVRNLRIVREKLRSE